MAGVAAKSTELESSTKAVRELEFNAMQLTQVDKLRTNTTQYCADCLTLKHCISKCVDAEHGWWPICGFCSLGTGTAISPSKSTDEQHTDKLTAGASGTYRGRRGQCTCQPGYYFMMMELGIRVASSSNACAQAYTPSSTVPSMGAPMPR